MSIKDRLAKKTEGLLVPPKADNASPATPSAPPLRTGPGQMLMVNSLMKENNKKLEVLEARLKEFEGALPVRLIDPALITASRWANRDKRSFDLPAFKALKEEIAEAGGNVQPIKVRPRKDDPERFELVFGHRRHRACLELDLPVLALVEDVSDQDLFKEMDRENRARADLAPWEQGVMYRRALSEQLFASQDQLARELGVDPGNLSKALRLADLPEAVVQAFASPLDLQFRWAKALNDALQADPDGVLARAQELSANRSVAQTPKEVFELLCGIGAAQPSTEVVIVDGKVVAKVVFDGLKASVQFTRGAIDGARIKELASSLQTFLSKK
ncbi:MAG TPA: ParB/RepB/Spo0J family partition protein [Noviherbaspirillum sp.]|jgi:ParB family chromosome partitioning protein|uniref:ParB/RepB/Spo0J family partition protein n=1 Tax=Noviherbaspirillum sp. TaxID=1926288 RepID=UPI002F93E4B8